MAGDGQHTIERGTDGLPPVRRQHPPAALTVAWVRLDDNFAENIKIARLSNDALAVWVIGLAYCNRGLTDGYIPRQVALGQLRLCPDIAATVAELEHVGVWDAEGDGWRVHDFFDYQPSKAEVLQLRDDRKAAGARGGKASGRAKDKQVLEQVLEQKPSKSQASAQAKSNPVPVPKKNKEHLRGAVAPVLNGQVLVAHLVNEAVRLNVTLPERSKGHAASGIKALLNDGMPEPILRRAITQVLERGRPVAALTDIARELQATGPPDESQRPTTGTYARLPRYG